MSNDSPTRRLSRELTVPLPDNDSEEYLIILREYVAKMGEISLLIDKEFPPLPSELSDIISQISKSGRVFYPWRYLYAVIIVKLTEVLNDFDGANTEKSEEHTIIMKNIDSLLSQRFKKAPPFTLQRICDLLSEPNKYYNSKLKYIRAFEKVITVISHAKVNCISPPPQSSYTPDSKFSPPAKRIKHEISSASTIVFSSDSTSSSERTSSFFPEEVSIDFGKIEKICEKSPPDCEQYTECSVSEADSTTLNGIRNIQDIIEGKDDNEATEQPSGTIGIQQDEPETSQQISVELAQEKSLIENSLI